MTVHACPVCGQPHPIREAAQMCVCGHPRTAHEDNGGRLKHAYCTSWTGKTGDVLTSWRQCTCLDYQAVET